jgi:hypothetical protein
VNRLSTEARFWPRVSRFGPESHLGDRCWIWEGSVTERGLGQFWRDGRNQRAHRVAWELTYGRVPQALRRLCAVRSCVNPAHWEPVPHQMNVYDCLEQSDWERVA